MKSRSCPCLFLFPSESKGVETSLFTSIQEFILVLDNQDQTDCVVEWLGSAPKTDAVNEFPSGPISCSACSTFGDAKRVSVASSLLSEIRGACQITFDHDEARDATGNNNNNKEPTSRASVAEMLSSVDDFPSLEMTKQSAVTQKKPASKSKEKRRIRPLHVSPTVTSSPSWGGAGNLIGLATPVKDVFPSVWGSERISVDGADGTNVFPTKNDNTRAIDLGVAVATKDTSTVQHSSPQVANDRQMGTSSPCEAPKKHNLQNLARVYSAVLDNVLCPSIAEEIRFLFQCLRLPTTSHTSLQGLGRTLPAFASILSSADHCYQFAIQVLQQQHTAVRQLCLVVPKLADSQLLQKHVPELATEVKHATSTFTTKANETVATSSSHLFPVEQSVQFTLPFDQRRDSRHNFKSSVGQALFVNREECRDSFVQQLRSFLTMRSSLLDSHGQSRAVNSVRQSACQLVQKTMVEGNSAWFAEFFCDMLVQTGNAPIQETDTELLQLMGDNAKVQKLHERFSAKPVRSSRRGPSKSNTSRRGQQQRDAATPSTSPYLAAQQLFPGHQEFFYLFLTASNHYAFSVHLRALIASRLREVKGNLQIQEKCMLARFLGVLVFSPNWCATTEGSLLLSVVDGVCDLESLGLPLLRLIQGKDCCRYLPLVVELLAMSRWDVHCGKSLAYRQVISYLRRLQIHLKRQVNDRTSAALLLAMDYLFGDALGLVETAALFIGDHGEIVDIIWDAQSLEMGIEILPMAPRAQLTDFLREVEDAASNNHRQGLGRVSRKLRPSAVVSLSKSSSSLSQTTKVPALLSLGGGSDALLGQLRASFFHRHGELKELCEFVARHSLKEIEARARHDFATHTEQHVSSETDITALRSWYDQKGASLTRGHFNDHVEKALSVLGLNHFGPAVIEEAAALTAAHCARLGRNKLEKMTAEEMERAKASIRRLQKKQEKQQHTSTSDNRLCLLGAVCLAVQNLNQSLQVAEDCPNDFDHVAFTGICRQVREALDVYFADISDTPSPVAARELFTATTALGERLGIHLVQIASNDCIPRDVRQNILYDILCASVRLARLSGFVAGKTREALRNTSISKMLQSDGLLENLIQELDDASFA